MPNFKTTIPFFVKLTILQDYHHSECLTASMHSCDTMHD